MKRKQKELRQLYGGRKPKSYKLAHNHIMHVGDTFHGERGFRRFWIPPQWIGDGWEKCPCGWHNGDTHYALSEHVKNWRKRIKKHGGLEGAYHSINKELAAYFKRTHPKAFRLMQGHLKSLEHQGNA
jgi:hypothetical protein